MFSIQQRFYFAELSLPISYMCSHIFTNITTSSKNCINIQFWDAWRAFWERHQITVWKHWFYIMKPLLSQPETLAFTAWNPCFHDLKPMLLHMRGINNENCKQTHCYFLQIDRNLIILMWRNVKIRRWINIQFSPRFA